MDKDTFNEYTSAMRDGTIYTISHKMTTDLPLAFSAMADRAEELGLLRIARFWRRFSTPTDSSDSPDTTPSE